MTDQNGQGREVGHYKDMSKNVFQSSGLLNWMPVIVTEKNETGQLLGAWEGHEFGHRHAEFIAPLRQANGKKIKQLYMESKVWRSK